jgi:hypothetical protein
MTAQPHTCALLPRIMNGLDVAHSILCCLGAGTWQGPPLSLSQTGGNSYQGGFLIVRYAVSCPDIASRCFRGDTLHLRSKSKVGADHQNQLAASRMDGTQQLPLRHGLPRHT